MRTMISSKVEPGHLQELRESSDSVREFVMVLARN